MWFTIAPIVPFVPILLSAAFQNTTVLLNTCSCTRQLISVLHSHQKEQNVDKERMETE